MPWIKPNWPAPTYIHALTTTRGHGLSRPPYASLNLAMHVQDAPQIVEQNRQRLINMTGLPDAPRWLMQYHSTVMLRGDDVVDAPHADASYTHTKGVVLTVLTADCLPILICDKTGSTIAAIHAGWRGLLDGIIVKNIPKLDIPAQQGLAWLGPAISAKAYAVGPEIRDLFMAQGFSAHAFEQHQGQWYMDLYALAREQLQRAGITAIYGGDYCTHRDSESFFSYRRDGITGRMASLIWMA